MFKMIKYFFWGSVLFCLMYFATDFKFKGDTFKGHVDKWFMSHPKLVEMTDKIKRALSTNMATKQMVDGGVDVKEWNKQNEEITKKENEQLVDVIEKNK